MNDVKMVCQVPGCDYSADHSQIARVQWDDMQQHLNQMHLKGRGTNMNNLPFTEQLKKEFAEHLKAMWDQLDDYMVTAMEWPQLDPNTPVAEKLQDEILKTKEVAAGRGMAEAIYIMCPADYSSSDDVVQLAVDRYGILKGVEVGSNDESEVPVPPGLGIMDPARGAAETSQAPAAPAPATVPGLAPISTLVVPQPTTAPAPALVPAAAPATTTDPWATPAPTTPTAPAPQPTSGLTAEQEEAIRTAIAGGLSVEMLAVSFGVPVETIRSVQGG